MEEEVVYKFRKELKKLKQYSGSGTELISVYIPVDYPIHETSTRLRTELGQASNIKSKSTKNNVTDALEKIINHLKLYNKTPKNGLCLFAGNVSDNPAKTDIELYYFEPPFPLRVNIYRCDSRFFLEPLEKIMDTRDSYGIVVMDGREATIAIVKGTEVTILKKMNSMAHAKIRKGGQSSRRFERLREESIDKFYIRVGESMDQFFLGKELKGVVVGGPGPTKEFFLKAKPFNYQIKVLGMVDTGYTEEYGVREVLAKSESILLEQEAIKEKVIVDRFIKEVVKGGLATYGLNEVLTALRQNKVSELLVSEGLTLRRDLYKCLQCNTEKEIISEESEKTTAPECETCKSKMTKEEEEPLIDYLIEFAQEKGIKIMVFSTNTSEGTQFLQGFGGMGAFLKYR